MKTVLGLDIGGTTVKALIMNEKRCVLNTGKMKTDSKMGIQSFLTGLDNLIASLTEGRKPDAIGIGCTGPLNYHTGEILNPYTLPGLEGNSLISLLGERYKIPVAMDNDANTAHLGEVSLFSPPPRNSVMMTFGTGVGVSARVGGKLFRCDGPVHPEMGHVPIGLHQTASCYCGHDDCIENILSGNAINKQCHERFQMTPEALFLHLDTKEKRSYREELVEALQKSVALFSIIFAPDVFYIGGGMAGFFNQYLLKDAQETLNTFLPVFGKAQLICAHADNQAGSRGAAELALSL